MTTHSTPPQADGLYDPRYEHDACGVAMVAKLDNAASHEVVVRAHEALAKAPSRVLIATLEDAAGVAKRPNMPGTVDEWPNWSLPLPLTVEELEESEQAAAIARALSSRDDTSPP